jgi:hypothetical protein
MLLIAVLSVVSASLAVTASLRARRSAKTDDYATLDDEVT